MKTYQFIFSVFAITALIGTVNLSAQTVWTGNTDNNITEAGNWDSGLPTAVGNPGTIGTGATVSINTAPLTGYFVTQNAGSAVSGPATTDRRFFDGSWTVNGGTFDIDGIFLLQNGTGVANGNQNFFITGGAVTTTLQTAVGSNANRTATFDLSAGSFTTRNLIVNDGSTLNISGGSFTATNNANASGVRANAGSIVNISGGTISSNQEFRAASSNILVTGGTSSFTRFNSDAGFKMTLAGSTAGTFTVGTVLAASEANLNFDWLTGSQMSLTITSIADWAETYWSDGRITYNGQNFNTLGNWATVSTTIFDWDGTTNTLALIPEPSTWALLAIGMTALVAFRRRRQA